MLLLLKNVFSNLIVTFCGWESEVFQSLKIRKYDEETEYFEKKDAFIF